MNIGSREELAWAAGLFDGEGCIGVYPGIRQNRHNTSHYITLQMSIGQSDRQVLDRFYQAVGRLGNVGGPYTYAYKLAPYYRWQARKFEHVQAIVAMLWTFLSPIKRQQATEALLKWRGDI
jgi:hypothetical protein